MLMMVFSLLPQGPSEQQQLASGKGKQSPGHVGRRVRGPSLASSGHLESPSELLVSCRKGEGKGDWWVPSWEAQPSSRSAALLVGQAGTQAR